MRWNTVEIVSSGAALMAVVFLAVTSPEWRYLLMGLLSLGLLVGALKARPKLKAAHKEQDVNQSPASL